MTTPPTYPASSDLVEGTGTRAFPSAVATSALDWVVVECIGEDGGLITDLTPTATGLTFGAVQTNVGASNKVRIQQWAAQDTTGGSRTVTITPNTGVSKYRARVTVVSGSAGVGTGKGTASAAQAMSIARQGDNSGMFMTVGDWSTGAVGSPAWAPGGATVASQQGTGATYIFGRWDDSGAAGTASHGITSPAYTTPSIAVLEMLGAAAPVVEVQQGVLRTVTHPQRIRR